MRAPGLVVGVVVIVLGVVAGWPGPVRALSPSAAAPLQPGRFARGMWVVRHDLADMARVTEVFARAERLGCTDLFLQVRGRADAFYRSQLSPPGQELAEGFDALATAVALAHARDIRVHAWMNLLLAWSSPTPPDAAAHVVRAHPEWFMTIETARGPRPSLEVGRRELDRLGMVGHFLSPEQPAVMAYLEAVAREVAGNYAIDGVHFDYVRYPDHQVAGPAGAVTELVARVAAAARTARPGLVVSVAVYPEPVIARERKGQDWQGWVTAGIVDLAVPMCYGAEPELMLREMRAARRVAGSLWAGVALYNKPLDIALRGVEGAWDLGFGGVVLFSHGSVRELGPAGELRLTDVLMGRKGR